MTVTGPEVSRVSDAVLKQQGASEARRLEKLHVVSSVLQELMFLRATVGQWPVWPFQCVKDILQHQTGLSLIDTLPTLSITFIFPFLLS